MATGGQPLLRTLNAACDECYDYSCSRCERRNATNSEASHYCTKCDELFCKTCIDVHGSFQPFEDHTILGRDKVKSWRTQIKNTKKPDPNCQEQCTRHPGQHVTMFCTNHNMVLCTVCVSLEHRNCDGMHYIPDLASGIKRSPYYTSVIEDFERVKSNINIVNKSRQHTKSSLDKSRKDFVDMIRGFRKQVNIIFDNLETKATTDTDKVYTESTSKADNDLEACNTFQVDLELLHQQLEPTNSDNEYQMFVNIKKLEKKISECDLEIQSLAESTSNTSFQMNIDPKTTNFLKDLQNLEELSVQQSTPPDINTDKQVIQYNNNEEDKHQDDSANNSTRYNIKIKSDTKECEITGSCLMPDGSIILTDNKNSKLKRLNNIYHVIDHCELPGAPRAVCCVGQQEVAVTVLHTISFVSIAKSKMTVTRSVDTGKSCYGIAYNDYKLFVSDNYSKVHMYNMSGKCLTTIHKDQNGHDIFTNPKHIAVHPDGSRIYVASFHKGLVSLDDSGRHLSTYEHGDESYGALGVCVDDKGSVFVGCCLSNNVVQLCDDGTRYLVEVAKLEDGEDLQSICLDRGLESLIVTLREKNYIKVFRLM